MATVALDIVSVFKAGKRKQGALIASVYFMMESKASLKDSLMHLIVQNWVTQLALDMRNLEKPSI